jgi:hypothetical protein
MDYRATGVQLRAARVLLQRKQRELAEQLAISVNSVQRAEAEHPGSRRTQRQLQEWLAREGIVFGVDGSIRRAAAAVQSNGAWRPASSAALQER